MIFAKFSNRVSCINLGRAFALNSNDSFPKKRINKITREKWMRGKAKCVYFGILIEKSGMIEENKERLEWQRKSRRMLR